MINLIVKDQEIQATLRRLLEKSQNTEPAMAGIAARMLAAVEDNFRAEGRPTKWKALKASTLAARASKVDAFSAFHFVGRPSARKLSSTAASMRAAMPAIAGSVF